MTPPVSPTVGARVARHVAGRARSKAGAAKSAARGRRQQLPTPPKSVLAKVRGPAGRAELAIRQATTLLVGPGDLCGGNPVADKSGQGLADELWEAYRREPAPGQRNRLVEHYQGLVRDIVRRFAVRLPRNVDRGDLLTAANVGLISAVSSFDPDRGVRFEAYGERRIKGALLDELRAQDWMPRAWRQRIEQHKRVIERLGSELGRQPLDDEVAEAMDLPLEEFQLLFGAGLPSAPAGSMPAAEDHEDGGASLDVVADPKGSEPGERLTRDELLSLVAQRLSDQEYRIVYLKYWEDLPLREIGELTGLSESRICKIHTQLIDRLKDRLRAHAG